MKVLVTGGAGYIGGHMVMSLLEQGVCPVILDDMSNGVPWALHSELPFHHGDVGDYELLAKVIRAHGVDTIMHFAAHLNTPGSDKTPLNFYLQNTVKTRTLLQAAMDFGIEQFVFSGTAAVYGNPTEMPISEETVVAPISPYGISKWVSEKMLADVAEVTGMRSAVLRYFNVAGADPQGRYGQSSTRTTLLIQIAVQCALGIRDGFEVFGTDYPTRDGTCVRDFIHVTDLIDAHNLALNHLKEGNTGLLCNVGYGHGFSVKEVIETVKAVSGSDFSVRSMPRRLGDPIESIADASRIRELLKWSPKYDDLGTIVRHALAWEDRMRQMYRF